MGLRRFLIAKLLFLEISLLRKSLIDLVLQGRVGRECVLNSLKGIGVWGPIWRLGGYIKIVILVEPVFFTTYACGYRKGWGMGRLKGRRHGRLTMSNLERPLKCS